MTDPIPSDRTPEAEPESADAPVLLRMTAPLREAFAVPYHALGPDAPTSSVALVAGLHGNEFNGVFVLARLANYLAGVAAGRYDGQQLTGRVTIVPAVNVLGLNLRTREWPFDKTDINRMFPGYDAGETTQRIAHAVLEHTRHADIRVDIHSSNEDFEEVPHVRLYDPSPEERDGAWHFGLPAVIEHPIHQVYSVTLGNAWRQFGGRNFVVQAGRAGAIQPEHCETLFTALVRMLAAAGVLDGVAVADEQDGHYFGLEQSVPLISQNAGIFVSKASVGGWLLAGSVIGFVYDGFSGRLLESITTPVAGMLSGLRRQPMLYEGDLIARIQTRHPMKRRIDTYLSGHGQ